jgi:hypothetical protein
MVGEEVMIDIKGKSVEELRELNRKRLVRVREIPEHKVWEHMKDRCNNPKHKK